MLKKGETDWIGKWFTVAKELGGENRASGGRADITTGHVNWSVINHEKEDGLGWLCASLRALGYKIPEIPRSKVIYKPELYKRPWILCQTLKNMKSVPIAWKEYNPEKERPFKKKFDWIYFSEAQTAAITSYAKTRNASINALFIKIFNDVLLTKLIDGPFESAWMFPVNMRGNVNLSQDSANHSSSIMIRVNQETTVQNIQHQIKHHLKSNIHWGTWWFGNIGKLVGLRGMKALSRRSRMNSFYLGTFSSFGNWPLPGSQPCEADPDEVWVAAPTGSPNYPIGSDNITWHGKFALSLKIHPVILSDQQRIADFLSEIKETALRLIRK